MLGVDADGNHTQSGTLHMLPVGNTGGIYLTTGIGTLVDNVIHYAHPARIKAALACAYGWFEFLRQGHYADAPGAGSQPMGLPQGLGNDTCPVSPAFEQFITG